MMKSEIEQILKELSKEFSTKTTALLEARKVFVSFDPERLCCTNLSVKGFSAI